jgi:hypothetical protein
MGDFTVCPADTPEPSGARRLIVTGGMTILHGQELKAALLAAMGEARGVVLDLRGVTEVDLSGLQCICAAHRMALSQQKLFVVYREGNPCIAALAAAAGYPRHTGCAQDSGHTCVWAEGGR